MKPSYREFSDLLLCFSQSTIDELTAASKYALLVYLAESAIKHGFKASKLYFTNKALQEFEHLNSYYFDVFARWIKS